MQATSPNYDPYKTTRKVDFFVRFELLDVNAKDKAVPTVSGQEDVSQLTQLTDGKTEFSAKYATLEDDSWELDGTYDLFPNDVTSLQTGWFSNVLSGADGVFTTPPHLSFSFGGTAISTIGFSLFFDTLTDNYATSIRVTTYASDGTTIIEQDTFSNEKAQCIINMPVQNYYSVKFEFLSTSQPYRRIRISECLFGIVQNFEKKDIVSANLTYDVDFLCETFPARQLSFTFENSDKKYNLINPSGLYAYLQEGQDISAKISIGNEDVNMGQFEFLKSKAADDGIQGEITAGDYVLSLLDSPVYNGGSNTTDTLQNVVNSVLSGLGITTSIATPSYTVSKAIPQGTTKREAIRLLAQAAMCSVWVDREGVLQIHPLSVSLSEVDELNADRMQSMAGIGVAEPVEKVTLTVKNEFDTDLDGNLRTSETTYTSGTGAKEKSFVNPCVATANGQAVADWLLAQANKRVKYEKQNRGNPAIEIGDTLKIYDAYGENRNAVVTSQELNYDGGLSAKTKAVGE